MAVPPEEVPGGNAVGHAVEGRQGCLDANHPQGALPQGAFPGEEEDGQGVRMVKRMMSRAIGVLLVRMNATRLLYYKKKEKGRGNGGKGVSGRGVFCRLKSYDSVMNGVMTLKNGCFLQVGTL